MAFAMDQLVVLTYHGGVVCFHFYLSLSNHDCRSLEDPSISV
jgi:hypothetical protein